MQNQFKNSRELTTYFNPNDWRLIIDWKNGEFIAYHRHSFKLAHGIKLANRSWNCVYTIKGEYV